MKTEKLPSEEEISDRYDNATKLLNTIKKKCGETEKYLQFKKKIESLKTTEEYDKFYQELFDLSMFDMFHRFY